MPPFVQCDKKEFSGPRVTSQQVRKDIFEHWYLFPTAVNHLCGKGNVIWCHELCLKMQVFSGRPLHFLAFHQSGTLNDDIKEEGKSAWTWFPALALPNKKQIAEKKETVLMLQNDYGPVNVEKPPNPTIFQPDGCKMTSRKTALTGKLSLQQREEKPNRPLSLHSEHEFRRVPSYLAA